MSESYTTGGDTLQSVDHPNWQGQTFHVLEDHILSFIDLEMRGAMRYNQPVIQVFYADSNHKPFGSSLSRNNYIVEQKCGLFTTGRVRFAMTPLLLSTLSYYAIVVSNFPPLLGNSASWLFDKDDATYPRGMRLSSTDGGNTWTVHHSDDFMFAEFGDPPLPKPQPPPPIDNFATIDISYEHTPTGIIISLATSVPCHLTCYWTDNPPLTHHTTRTVRGITVPWGQYFCFVGWHAVEQSELGDTIYHTFTLEPWYFCTTRWFTFRGNVDDLLSPSVGPIFQHHHSGILPFLNGDFELWPNPVKPPTYWNKMAIGSGASAWVRCTTEVYSGKYSFQAIAQGDAQRTHLQQQVYAEPYRDKIVRFSAWRHWGYQGIPQLTFFITGPGAWSITYSYGAFGGWQETFRQRLIPSEALTLGIRVGIYSNQPYTCHCFFDKTNIVIVS